MKTHFAPCMVLLLTIIATACNAPPDDPAMSEHKLDLTPLNLTVRSDWMLPEAEINPFPRPFMVQEVICCLENSDQTQVLPIGCFNDFNAPFSPPSPQHALDHIHGIWNSAKTTDGGIAILSTTALTSWESPDSSAVLTFLNSSGEFESTHVHTSPGYALVANDLHILSNGKVLIAGSAHSGDKTKLFCRITDENGGLLSTSFFESLQIKNLVKVFGLPDNNQLIAVLAHPQNGCGSPLYPDLRLLLYTGSSFEGTIASLPFCVEATQMIGFSDFDGSPILAWVDNDNIKVARLRGTFPAIEAELFTYLVGPNLVLRAGNASPEGALMLGGRVNGTAFLLKVDPGQNTSKVIKPFMPNSKSSIETIHWSCDNALMGMVNVIGGRAETWIWKYNPSLE